MNHFNKKGNPHIVDVSNKAVNERVAIASGEIKFDKETYKKIKTFKSKKGDIEKIAIIAGIMGAKETSRLIPLCHNIPINHVKTNSNTGVEMEALTSVTLSCLTIYDMCKYLNKRIVIHNVKLKSKTGGKSNI